MQEVNNKNRRLVLKKGLAGAAGLACMPVLGSLTGCSQQTASPLPIELLAGDVSLISGAPGNVLALNTSDGFMLVDSGSLELARSVMASLEGANVHTLFNTHYHADQSGGNALFGEAGATIHAHKITGQWLSADYYVPSTDSWVEAPAESARPTEIFRNSGEMSKGSESIAYGYLLEAHTRGDSYVFFRDSNVLAVGDVASPLVDPTLDWYSGGWIGGRVDAMDDLLELANDETMIVPSYGSVMNKAELQTERDMMMHLFQRTSELIAKGHSAQDMLEVGLMEEIDRKFDDPYKFLYDTSKSLWAHYTNFGGKIV